MAAAFLVLSFDKTPCWIYRLPGANGWVLKMAPSDVLLRKLKVHSHFDKTDIAAIRRLRCEIRELTTGEDFIRQGDKPNAAAIVLEDRKSVV